MTFSMKVLKWNPVTCVDSLVADGEVAFDREQTDSPMDAAIKFHHALCQYASVKGYGANLPKLQRPIYESAWGVEWEEGPFEWAINIHGVLFGATWYAEPVDGTSLCFEEK